MAAPALDVDWEAVKAQAILVGPRQAARSFGLSEGTVTNKCFREGWLKALTAPVAAPALPTSMQPKKVNAVKPAQAALNTVLRCSGKTRLNFAKGLVKGSREIARKDGTWIVNQAHQLKALASTAKDVFPDWATPDQRPLINIQIGPCSTADPAPIQVIDCTQEAE